MSIQEAQPELRTIVSYSYEKVRRVIYLDDGQIGPEVLPSEERCGLSYLHCEDGSEEREHVARPV
jgi:hypothetical protein